MISTISMVFMPVDSVWAAIGYGSLIYLGLSILSMVAFVLLSMWLGRKDKFVLKKNSSYPVVDINDDYLTIVGGETLKMSCIDTVVYSSTITAPVLNVRRFNIGGWRKRWFYEAYPDVWEYYLYLPETR